MFSYLMSHDDPWLAVSDYNVYVGCFYSLYLYYTIIGCLWIISDFISPTRLCCPESSCLSLHSQQLHISMLHFKHFYIWLESDFESLHSSVRWKYYPLPMFGRPKNRCKVLSTIQIYAPCTQQSPEQSSWPFCSIFF